MKEVIYFFPLIGDNSKVFVMFSDSSWGILPKSKVAYEAGKNHMCDGCFLSRFMLGTGGSLMLNSFNNGKAVLECDDLEGEFFKFIVYGYNSISGIQLWSNNDIIYSYVSGYFAMFLVENMSFRYNFYKGIGIGKKRTLFDELLR